MSLRSVRYAQAELRVLGWIGKDTGSKQRKLNRHGAWFSIDLDWNPSEIGSNELVSEEPQIRTEIAPPPPESCTPVAPPKKDPKTLSESKNQKPGVFGKENQKAPQPKAAPLPVPNLKNILPTDLSDQERLESLFQQAVDREWVRPCESDKLNFLAAAIRARTTSAREPVRVFVTLVKRRQWSHVTQAQEDEGRRAMQSSVPFQPVGTTRGASSFGRLGEIVKSLVSPGGQATSLLTDR